MLGRAGFASPRVVRSSDADVLARLLLTVSVSMKTSTSEDVGAPKGVPNQPPFLSRIPGWMPPVTSKVWPSGQFLTVCSRWVIETSGTSIDISGGPCSRGTTILVSSQMRFNRMVVLAGVIALFCMGGEKVCFGLLNEPWPNPTDAVWWAGANKSGSPTIGRTPATGIRGKSLRIPTLSATIFTVPPNGVSESGGPVYTGDPNIVIIRTGEVAERNYLRLGGSEAYVNLVVQGTLNVGGGPGTWGGLRIDLWTNWGKTQVIIDGGTLNVNGDTDQSDTIVSSGYVNVIGQIGLGAV